MFFYKYCAVLIPICVVDRDNTQCVISFKSVMPLNMELRFVEYSCTFFVISFNEIFYLTLINYKTSVPTNYTYNYRCMRNITK
jgi:hypothetical protein